MIFLELEYFRLEIGNKIPILSKIWGYVRREKEKNQIGGDIFFLIGAILVLAVFDIRIAVAGILMTTFGDLSAALIGSKFGKHYFKNFKDRAWEGIFAEFFVNILIGILVLIFLFGGSFYSLVWVIIITMALTATFVETIVSKIDYNLLIPIFSCFNGQIALFSTEFFYKNTF